MNSLAGELEKALSEAFFGDSFLKYLKLRDDILGCKSLKEFRKLKVNFESEEATRIYEVANFVPKPGTGLAKDKASHIFNTLKPIPSVANFI